MNQNVFINNFHDKGGKSKKLLCGRDDTTEVFIIREFSKEVTVKFIREFSKEVTGSF